MNPVGTRRFANDISAAPRGGNMELITIQIQESEGNRD
jgi:hypothetical protein